MFPAQVIKDKEAPPIALLVVFLKKYGVDALYWEPEVIETEITNDFSHQPSALQFDKLHGAINVLVNNTYEQYWETFETTNHLFSNTPHIPGEHDPLTPEESVVGYAHAMLIRNEPIVLDDEICRYLGEVFYEGGLSKAPTVMPFSLMPEYVVESDDTDYNSGLDELWKCTIERVVNYMSNIDFPS